MDGERRISVIGIPGGPSGLSGLLGSLMGKIGGDMEEMEIRVSPETIKAILDNVPKEHVTSDLLCLLASGIYNPCGEDEFALQMERTIIERYFSSFSNDPTIDDAERLILHFKTVAGVHQTIIAWCEKYGVMDAQEAKRLTRLLRGSRFLGKEALNAIKKVSALAGISLAPSEMEDDCQCSACQIRRLDADPETKAKLVEELDRFLSFVKHQPVRSREDVPHRLDEFHATEKLREIVMNSLII